MTLSTSNENGPQPHWWRALAWLLLFVLLAALLSVDAFYVQLQRLLDAAKPLISANPGWGGLVFVLLSAVSAMLAFFSSAVLVPAAVYSWGTLPTIALLWLGWLVGGMCAFGIGHTLGRPLVNSLGSAKVAEFYRQRLSSQVGFPVVFLLQLGLPSEIPGYLCGLLHVRFRVYVMALALAELPYAIGTVLVGESILRREGGWLIALGLTAAVASGYALYLLHKALRRNA